MATPLYDDGERLRKAFGRRVRELRTGRISQDRLARETEMHTTSIGRIERGGRDPRLSTILKLAEGLGVEPGVLVNALEEPLSGRVRPAHDPLDQSAD
jgi:transcriptional regulator with XRE-family HTH domain